MSANKRLCKLKIQQAHCFYSPSFKLMHWHVFSPYLNLPLKTRIIFTSLKKSENKPLSGMISETTAVMEGHRHTSLKFKYFTSSFPTCSTRIFLHEGISITASSLHFSRFLECHETISQQRHVLRDITKNGYEFLTVVPYSSCINTYSSFSDDVAIRLGILVPDFDVI